MEEFIERVDDFRLFLRRLFRRKKVRRMAIELLIAIVVGILSGCITYNVLNKKDNNLTVSKEKAMAIEDTSTATAADTSDTEDSTDAAAEEDFSDVKITVVDPGSYAASIKDWSAEQIDAAVKERSSYLANNKYWPAVSSYWESDRNVTDTSCYCMYLFNTDTKVYTAEDFSGLSKDVIHVAKNEIYARHGYSFRDAEMMNYFMGQIWYNPTVMPADFTEDIFTETEVKNLDLLNSIDK